MWKRLSAKVRISLWFLTIVLWFGLLLLLVYGVFSAFTAQSRMDGTVQFTYGSGSRYDPSVEGSRRVYLPNGTAYANFTLLSQALQFSQSGTEEEIRYIIEIESGVYDTVTFYRNSRGAVVNGVHVTLASPVEFISDGVMVPCEFLTRYMTGVTVEVKEDAVRVIFDEGKVSLLPAFRQPDPIVQENTTTLQHNEALISKI
ncbi:MAG: hypothetical protein IJW46_05325 [Clostridia bacterium]|nr:hypothetical protein [Clostridia bacterium]